MPSQCSSSDADTDALLQISAFRMVADDGDDIVVIRNDEDVHTTGGFDIDNHLRGTGAASGVVAFFGDLLDATLGGNNDGDAFRYDQIYTLGQSVIFFDVGDDIFVYAPDNLRTISVTAKDDAFIYAPSNHGTITALGNDVFAFTPDNSGSIFAFANTAADAYAVADAEAKESGDAIAVAKAVALSEADIFVYAPDNHGAISAHADAVSTANADSSAQVASGDATAIADADADARARTLVYAPGGSEPIDASANAVVEVTADAQTNSELGFAMALSDVTVTAETLVIQQGKYDYQWFA